MERNRNIDKFLPMPVSDDIVKGDVIYVCDMHTKKIMIYECVREENHAPYCNQFRCLDGIENSREGAWGILPDQYKWKKNNMNKKVIEEFLEEEFSEKTNPWFNMYNFISFWYGKSMMDGILDSQKMLKFLEDFLGHNGTFHDNPVQDTERVFKDFEKTLTKFYKKLEKVGPGSFEG